MVNSHHYFVILHAQWRDVVILSVNAHGWTGKQGNGEAVRAVSEAAT